eukprot:TRINITY_DN9435_c0_g1_i1.p1 TRINITY_DN9435_c0_g1~~TRINITY_DN9435_c0_g1_i1.p1  ORF type:complete len:487 (-),score=82.77 TRINITY_DN9435_c0_g1_i1:40-1500(-)
MMRKLEIAKWAMLYGLNDCMDDMVEYYLYWLIPISYAGCGGVDQVFGKLLLAKGIANCFNKFLAGWISDAMEKHQHITLISSCIGLIVTGCIFLFFGADVKLTGLAAFYIMHQFFIVLNENATWKCIKYRLQLIYGKENTAEQEETVGSIGVWGELFSDCYETIWLCLTWVIIDHTTFDYSRWMMLLSCLVCYLASTLISITFTRQSFYSKGEDHLIFEESETLLDKEESTIQTPTYKNQSTLVVFIHERLDGLRVFITNKLPLHVIIMGLFLYAFNELFEYPITFAEANGNTSSGSGSDSGSGSANNFCNGSLRNLCEESALDNAAYIGGAVAYFLFFVRMPSRIFFSLAFPLVCVGTIVLALPLLFFFPDLSSTVAYIITSIDLVIPYYLERYLLYFWTSLVDEKHYGFYYGMNGLFQQLIHVISSQLLINTDNLTSASPLFSILLSICFVLIAFDYVYSIYLFTAYRTFFNLKGGGAPEQSHT